MNYVKQSPLMGVIGYGGGATSLGRYQSAAADDNYSVFFDGTNDRLEIADTTDFEFGSGDFTVEAWIRIPEDSGANADSFTIVNKWHNTSNAKEWILRIQQSSGNKLEFIHTTDGSSNIFTTGNTDMKKNTWYHVAAVGDSGVIKLFVNGTQQSSTGSQGTINAYSNPLYFGYNLSSNGQWMDGKISNARIIKGTAQYTSSFTPSTSALTSVTNTKLLCCNGDDPTDATTTPSTITNSGTITSTDNPFAINVYSVDFDGSDFFETATDSDLNIGTGDFTVEFWARFNSDADSDTLACVLETRSGGGSTSDGFMIARWNTQSDRVSVYMNGFLLQETDSTAIDTWNHWALVRSSGTCTFYKNGKSQGTFSSSHNWTNSKWYIGCLQNESSGGGPTNAMEGFISQFRFTKAVVYSSNFPTPGVLTALNDTKLLCCNQDSGADAVNESTGVSLTTHGDPTVSTTSPLVQGGTV